MPTPLQDSLPRTAAIIEQGLAAGLHIGAQIFVSLQGKEIVNAGIGESRPGVPMSSDTIMLWMSATKPLGAVALAQLWEQGRVDLDDRIEKFVPEFGVNGKAPITIRHALTHTGGFRVEARWSADPWDQIIARICAAKLEHGWVPGEKAGYHPASSWFMLAEIIRRLDGRAFETYVDEEIFRPLGMNDSWLAIPPERYRAYGERIGILHNTERTPQFPQLFDSEERCAVCRPGGSGHGPVRELGRFYEMLLARGTFGGKKVLSPQTVEALTARHRVDLHDHTFNHKMDWGLGFVIDSNHYGKETAPYGYGRHCSPRTFGHGGYQSSSAFADPERGLVVAWVFNGTPGEDKHDVRCRDVNSAIYEDLSLVGGE